MIKGLSRLLGHSAEQQARAYMEQHGLSFVGANYHSRRGEIDLIMKDGMEWVFVEVKYRKNAVFGYASEFFHARKRDKFEATVHHYLHQLRLNPASTPFRIDLIAITGDQIEWIKHV